MSSATEQLVIVSNGEEFYEIPVEHLEDARQDGFYLPHERGLTVVSNGEETLEIPRDVLADAEADGYRNLIPDPPQIPARQPRSGKPQKRQSKGPARTTGQKPEKPSAEHNQPSRRRRTTGAKGSKQQTRPEQVPAKRRPRRKKAESIPGPPVAAQNADEPVQIDTGDTSGSPDPSVVRLQTDEEQPVQETAPVTIDTGDDAVVAGPPAIEEVVLEEVVDEDEERRREIEEQLAETEDWKERLKLLVQLHCPTRKEVNRFSRTYGLSMALHVVVLLLLSLLVFQSAEKADGGAVISSIMSDEEVAEEAEELPQEVKVQETDQTDSKTANAADPAGALSDNLGSASDLNAFAGANVGGGLDGLAEEIGQGVDKMTGTGEKTAASFFGQKQLASRFVFVIDNSLSMTRGRFETALNELAKTVMALKPQQSFYIIFYSDTAYGLFHPQTVNGLIPATKRNKKLTIQWLLTVQLCLRTDFAEALQMAYALDPDVIFVLGDGGFTDQSRVRREFAARSEEQKKIKIHTLGMELDNRGVKNFKALSEPTGGTYRDVGVHPLGARMAQQNPRKRNRTRGPIWGIKLKN